MPEITIPDQTPWAQYVAGAGPQTVYTYNWPILDQGDINVEIRRGTTRSTGVTFTVAGVGDQGGGTVTVTGATPALAEGDIVTVYSDQPVERSTDFNVVNGLEDSDLNLALDRIITMVRDLERRVLFATKMPPDDDDSLNMNIPLADVRKGLVAAYDSIGEPTVLGAAGLGALIDVSLGPWIYDTIDASGTTVVVADTGSPQFLDVLTTSDGTLQLPPLATVAADFRLRIVRDAGSTANLSLAGDPGDANPFRFFLGPVTIGDVNTVADVVVIDDGVGNRSYGHRVMATPAAASGGAGLFAGHVSAVTNKFLVAGELKFLVSVDSTSAAFDIHLPAIAGIGELEYYGFDVIGGSNNVTIRDALENVVFTLIPNTQDSVIIHRNDLVATGWVPILHQ